MTQPHRELGEARIPLGYHITFRCYGTWLHGDERGSVDRFHNRYGSPLISPNRPWKRYNKLALKRPPVKLTARAQSGHRGGHSRNLQNTQMAIVGAERQNKPCPFSCVRELRPRNNPDCIQSKCDTQDERNRLLAKW